MTMITLTQEEIALLKTLVEHGGESTITGNKDRGGLNRLVAANYVTSRSVSMDKTVHAITEAGRTALALSRYGVSSQITSTIEPYRDDHGLWRVKFGGS